MRSKLDVAWHLGLFCLCIFCIALSFSFAAWALILGFNPGFTITFAFGWVGFGGFLLGLSGNLIVNSYRFLRGASE